MSTRSHVDDEARLGKTEPKAISVRCCGACVDLEDKKKRDVVTVWLALLMRRPFACGEYGPSKIDGSKRSSEK